MGSVGYILALPLYFSGVHPMFHVSMLKKYHEEGHYIIQQGSLLLDGNLFYKEELIVIPDRDSSNLRTKSISSMKDLWNNHLVEAAT